MLTHRSLVPLSLLVAVALAPAAAGAKSRTFVVVSAKHTSTATKHVTDYDGTSTVQWSLAKRSKQAPNRVTVNTGGGMTSGLGTVNATGTYKIDATTPQGHCAWTAATGDSERGAVAPGPFQLTFGPDPRTGRGLLATYSNPIASLGNAFLPSECSTELDGEPDADEALSTKVKPKALKRRKLTLKFNGQSSGAGETVTWSTTIKLRRGK